MQEVSVVQCFGPKRISVLYLDDEPVCLELFGETFGAECEVRTAATREEALRALAESEFDVVISDERMPGANGTEFLQEVERAAPGSLRVLLSGAVAVGQVLPALASGAVEFFVPKPWSVGHLRQVFDRIAFRC